MLKALLLFAALTPAAMAKDYVVCAADIPNAITDNREGPQPYRTFFKKVAELVKENTGHSFSTIVRSAHECVELCNAGEVQGVWPFIIKAKEEYIHSMPMIMGSYFIFTSKSAPRINSVDGLKGKKVASAKGYGIPQGIQGNTEIEHIVADSHDDLLNLIRESKVDAVIIQSGWISVLQDQGKLKKLHSGKGIDLWGGSFVFRTTKENAVFAGAFTTAILQLVSDGEYKRIMNNAPYFIPSYK